MRRRVSHLVVSFTWLAIVAGCGREPAPPLVELEVGHFRLRLSPPEGWERLDHGRQQLFRNGEVELRLEDLGPVTRQGLERELEAAKQLLLAGRRADALARVRELHGPPLQLLSSDQRAQFWKPWTDVTYIPEQADDASLDRAFEALLSSARELPDIDMDALVEHVLARSSDFNRREIARQEERSIHGYDWVVVETWDRVSHGYRRQLACLEDRGYLLTLHTERGLIEQSASAFESLLGSIEILPVVE